MQFDVVPLQLTHTNVTIDLVYGAVVTFELSFLLPNISALPYHDELILCFVISTCMLI